MSEPVDWQFVARVPLCVLLAGATLALAACGGTTAPAGGEAAELRSVEQFASAFEADGGKPRLVLLLSPT